MRARCLLLSSTLSTLRSQHNYARFVVIVAPPSTPLTVGKRVAAERCWLLCLYSNFQISVDTRGWGGSRMTLHFIFWIVALTLSTTKCFTTYTSLPVPSLPSARPFKSGAHLTKNSSDLSPLQSYSTIFFFQIVSFSLVLYTRQDVNYVQTVSVQKCCQLTFFVQFTVSCYKVTGRKFEFCLMTSNQYFW